jgi:hypothetical protein
MIADQKDSAANMQLIKTLPEATERCRAAMASSTSAQEMQSLIV